jgi:septin family protein
MFNEGMQYELKSIRKSIWNDLSQDNVEICMVKDTEYH